MATPGFQYAGSLGGGRLNVVPITAGCGLPAGIHQLSSDGVLTSAATNDGSLIATIASAASGTVALAVDDPKAYFYTDSYYTSTCQTGDNLDWASARGLGAASNNDVLIVKVDRSTSAVYVRIAPGEHIYD